MGLTLIHIFTTIQKMRDFVFIVLVSCCFCNVTSLLFADSFSHECRFYRGSRMAHLLDQTDLEEKMEEDGPCTFFCPTDDHFPYDLYKKILNNNKLLQKVVKYHILNGTYRLENFTNEEEIKTLDDDIPIRVNVYRLLNENFPTVTINGVKFSSANHQVKKTNGTVHLTKGLFYPVPTESILGVLSETSHFTTLLYALTKANLESTLSGGPFTMFAPTNKAFQKLPPGLYADLINNETALQDVITYHVLKGTIYTAGINDDDTMTSLNSENLNFQRVNGSVIIEKHANITTGNMAVTNGVIHTIDTVLLPKSLKQKSIALP